MRIKKPKQLATASIVCAGSMGILISTIFGRSDAASAYYSVIARAPRSPLVQEVWHGDRSKQQIMLTFDGGDGNVSSEAILSALGRHGMRASFFLTGKFVERNPELVKKIQAAGHEIYNHTYDHPHLTELKDSEIERELYSMDVRLGQLTGSSTKPYFRPPYGDRDHRVLEIARKAGYSSVYWTVDAHDWQTGGTDKAKEARERILGSLAPGNIYLLHLGDRISGEIIDDVLGEIEKRGFKEVSLTEGL